MHLNELRRPLPHVIGWLETKNSRDYSWKIAWPPVRVTLAIFFTNSSGFETKQSTQRHQLKSYGPAGKSSLIKSSSRTSIFKSDFDRAVRRMAFTKLVERSTATTFPFGPTISARSTVA